MIEKSLYFYKPSEAMPKDSKMCVICVDHGEAGESVFFGKYADGKWYGAIPEPSCLVCDFFFEEICGTVLYWAKFPVSFDF